MYVTPEQIQAASKANVETFLAVANTQFAALEKLAHVGWYEGIGHAPPGAFALLTQVRRVRGVQVNGVGVRRDRARTLSPNWIFKSDESHDARQIIA